LGWLAVILLIKDGGELAFDRVWFHEEGSREGASGAILHCCNTPEEATAGPAPKAPHAAEWGPPVVGDELL